MIGRNVIIALLALQIPVFSMAGKMIPYPKALSASAIAENSISNISRNGLFIGNGELNAIVYTSGNQIHLRVSKNDSWDNRIKTSSNRRDKRHGSAHWNDFDFPTQLPCVEIALCAGGTVKLVSPWPNQGLTVVEQKSATDVPVVTSEKIVVFSTKPGRTYVVLPITI